ncbi:ABC transporter substrate-binding protein [Desulfatibacillum aliphaticivorans]|uniref:ABC transporter substrate-binding protein n=1 Tax=Desulfatibacillum aliphaticivorans TaxID=218208 RepID=UPI0004266CBD|nr:ABC transporter substrate-binding protein [Desulfatibacillum aliphaticivorans]
MIKTGGKIFVFLFLILLAGRTSLGIAQTGDSVKIAAIFAQTGATAPMDKEAFEALRWTCQRINHQGGVLGKPVKVLEYDNQSTSLGSLAAGKKAIRDGATAVVGASWSAHSLAIAHLMQEAKIPMISPASTNPALTKIGDYIFRVCASDEFSGKALADFASERLNAKTVVVLTNANSQFSRDLAAFFIDQFNKKGTVLWEGDYLQDASDFSQILEKVKSLQPEVVFVPGYPRDSGYILRQAQNMGVKSIFLGADGWNYLMTEYAGSAVNGHYFSDLWHAGLPNPKSKAFLEEYNKDGFQVKISLAPLAYDSLMVIVNAINKAGTLNTAAIRDAIAATKDYEGVTGNISFNQFGDPIKPIVILKFDNNQPMYYMTIRK